MAGVNVGNCRRSRPRIPVGKATALKMHDKVRAHWAAELERVQTELGHYNLAADRKAELLKRLDVLKTTDMALIVSPGQNEIEQMKKLGLDIEPHRKRMVESQPCMVHRRAFDRIRSNRLREMDLPIA
jgi:type I restriction enzyme R subunit